MMRRSVSYEQRRSVHQEHRVVRVRQVVKGRADLTVVRHTQHAEIGTLGRLEAACMTEMTRAAIVYLSFVWHVSHSRYVTISKNCK